MLRDDVYMLGQGRHGRRRPHLAGAVVERGRGQLAGSQPAVDLLPAADGVGEGYSGQAFNTHVPHTVRTTETKTCTDCHVSANGDNNAVMAQLLLHGTNFVNFMGRFVYVATGRRRRRGRGGDRDGRAAGGHRQRPAPARLSRASTPSTSRRGRELHDGRASQLDERASASRCAASTSTSPMARAASRSSTSRRSIQKGFSEKIVSAPVSPIGQDTNVKTRHATAVAAPSTLAVDPARLRLPENEEQPIHPMYAYIYITDLEEGLVLSTAATLLDGNPSNNFLQRAAAFNPDGRLQRRARTSRSPATTPTSSATAAW